MAEKRMAGTTGVRLLRRQQVEELVAISRRALYRAMRDPARGFPAPISLGPGCVRWVEDEVVSWLAERPRATGQ